MNRHKATVDLGNGFFFDEKNDSVINNYLIRYRLSFKSSLLLSLLLRRENQLVCRAEIQEFFSKAGITLLPGRINLLIRELRFVIYETKFEILTRRNKGYILSSNSFKNNINI